MDTEKYIDLHIHSRNSDGERTVSEIIEEAKQNNIKAVALTDHNSFSAYHTYTQNGIEVIPGCEFSTINDMFGKKKEVHIVGLFFDFVDQSIDIAFSGVERNAYVKALIHMLNNHHMNISYEELVEFKKNEAYFSRYDLADLIVQKGYASDREKAMDEWIGNFSPYYINPAECVPYISMSDCVKLICEHHGLPILAHPYHYKYTTDEIEQFTAYFRSITDKPLGIEVYYKKYSEEQIKYLEYLADKYGLLRSAASDSHKRTQQFIKGKYDLLEKMKVKMRIE